MRRATVSLKFKVRF